MSKRHDDELAAKINAAHAAVKRQTRATITSMMSAGDGLREAKKLAAHGNWLSWLRTNCPDISERTAHLYMRFAKWRPVIVDAVAKSATIADLERDQLRVPMGLAVGPFGVVDAIAAIHEAEHHETKARENRQQLAAKQQDQIERGAMTDHAVPFRSRQPKTAAITPAGPPRHRSHTPRHQRNDTTTTTHNDTTTQPHPTDQDHDTQTKHGP